METQYMHYKTSVGNNLKHIQITTKYRYEMMQKELIKVYCRVAIEEACKRYKIEIIIVNVQSNHVHLIVNIPRTMCDSKAMQLIKGFSSYLLFRLCPNFRKRYTKGAFWNEGYFCCAVGADFDRTFEYVKNQ